MHPKAGRGFTIIDLVVALAVAAMLGLGLVGLMADARRNAGLAQSIANLKRFGDGIRAHVLERDDAVPGYTWSATHGHSEYADLEAQRLRGGLSSHAAQAVDMLRRLDGREDILPISSWLVQPEFVHLPLLEFLGEDMLASWTASPGDDALQRWREDPYDTSVLPCEENDCLRWPYTSSYEMGPTWWAPEEGTDRMFRLTQAVDHRTYSIASQTQIVPRRYSTCVFPSEKVLMHERFSWYYGQRAAFFAYREARVPILFADGRVDVRAVGESNRGWKPSLPQTPSPTTFYYRPAPWEPPALEDQAVGDRVDGRIRWTRGGALGRDFDGPEIDTGQL
ncbi:MAG: hypothetical protein H6811_05630 [Phycisphaeraceae bacterium]|nr:hypothetical protein [Phycisphaeraceae bacterium]